MADPKISTKGQLLEQNERAWAELQAALDGLTEAQMTGLQDAVGWTIKDHIAHLAAWERSVVFMLQGKPRYDALGISEEVFNWDDFDATNAVMFPDHQRMTLAEATQALDQTHRELTNLVESLSDAEIQERGDAEGRPAMGVIYANSGGHYREHLPWMLAIAEHGG